MILYQAEFYRDGFDGMVMHMLRDILTSSPVDTGHWQAMEGLPMTKTIEMQNVCLDYDMPEYVDQLLDEVKPNMPWAEDHFQERVGGDPTNPGEQYMNWPHWRGGHTKGNLFSHTYQERFWPKTAGRDSEEYFMEGIRYPYGDLQDVVELLLRQPHTRQAYLPVFFPEDTGSVPQERVPCTLGYHFMVRQERLHCSYFIRSCDLLRHFRDDVYLAVRLAQWVRNTCQEQDEKYDAEGFSFWNGTGMGNLMMVIPSLHIFEADVPVVERKVRERSKNKP